MRERTPFLAFLSAAFHELVWYVCAFSARLSRSAKYWIDGDVYKTTGEDSTSEGKDGAREASERVSGLREGGWECGSVSLRGGRGWR